MKDEDKNATRKKVRNISGTISKCYEFFMQLKCGTIIKNMV